ncbi:hypothetical protein HG530_013515 [Fusarium avenaceum]|nr:hypothetical protein HG530_013515 [Fusarium avenaceum]
MFHSILQRPALSTPKRKRPCDPHRADGVQPVGVLHDGQLRICLHQSPRARWVLHFGGVADAEADGLDGVGEGLRCAERDEH